MNEKTGLSRNTKIFSITSFLVDLSSEAIFPLLPFFITVILGGGAFALGIVEAFSVAAIALFGIFSGYYTDKVGKRKRVILLGYSISAVTKLFFAFATSWLHVLLIRFLERIGKGIRDPPRDALIALSEKGDKLGKAFGFRQMADSAGAILGPVVALMLLLFYKDLPVGESYRSVFLIASIPGILAVFALFLIRDIKGRIETKTQPFFAKLSEYLWNPRYRQFLLANMIFFLGNFSIAFFILRSGEFLSIEAIPVAYLAYNVFYTLSAMPVGILTDRIGAKKMVIIGYVIYLLSLAAFAYSSSFGTFLISFAVLGIFTAIFEVAPPVYLVKKSNNNEYGGAIAAYNGITRISSLLSNILAGAVWTFTLFSLPSMFLFSGITTVISLLILTQNK